MTVSGLRANRTCLILADDLTGACDSAVHFAAAGASATVALGDVLPTGADVVAFSTDSRDLPPAQAAQRVREAAKRAGDWPGFVFKKIDSTLRGNPWPETVAAMEAFGCDLVVVNPAFPRMGRVVEAGVLRVEQDPAFAGVDVSGTLAAHVTHSCRHLERGSVAEAIEAGMRFISTDAICQQDLSRLAAEVLAAGRKVLWAGSGGLAAALAAELQWAGEARRSPADVGATLFCLGSDHPVTVRQERRLVENGAAMLDARNVQAGALAQELSRGRSVVLRIRRGAVPSQRLREAIGDARPALALLSGGDTASVVCGAMGAESIALTRELAPGIPEGMVHGGAWEGIRIATKSGGFGDVEDLARIAAQIARTCPATGS